MCLRARTLQERRTRATARTHAPERVHLAPHDALLPEARGVEAFRAQRARAGVERCADVVVARVGGGGVGDVRGIGRRRALGARREVVRRGRVAEGGLERLQCAFSA
jgi:hypothetical protein